MKKLNLRFILQFFIAASIVPLTNPHTGVPLNNALASGKDAAQAKRNAASTKVPAAKERAIRQLLQQTQVSKMAINVMTDFVTRMLAANPNLSKEDKAEFSSNVRRQLRVKEIEDLYVPIYAKHYSLGEINTLLKFYRSPIGKKLVSTQPLIMKESQQAGQAWGKGVMERAVRSLVEKQKKKKALKK